MTHLNPMPTFLDKQTWPRMESKEARYKFGYHCAKEMFEWFLASMDKLDVNEIHSVFAKLYNLIEEGTPEGGGWIAFHKEKMEEMEINKKMQRA